MTMSQQAELFTPGRRLTQLAQQKPDEIALIVERQDGSADTLIRLQMEQWANRLAHRLAEVGVKQKSFVAVNLPNGQEHVVGTLAAYKLGAPARKADPARVRLRREGAQGSPRLALRRLSGALVTRALACRSAPRRRKLQFAGLPVAFEDDAGGLHAGQMPTVDGLAFRHPLADRLSGEANKRPAGGAGGFDDADELHARIQARRRRRLDHLLVAFDELAVGIKQRALHGLLEDDEGLVVERCGKLGVLHPCRRPGALAG
jgi:AMP-binding enzyme